DTAEHDASPFSPIRDATKTPRTCAYRHVGAPMTRAERPLASRPASATPPSILVRPGGGQRRRRPGCLARRQSPRYERGPVPADRPRGARHPGDRGRGGLAMPRWRDWDDDDPGLVHDPEDEDWPDDWDDEPTMPCPHCRREVREDAERCPYCEHYLSKED